jgi:hypothetical protein
LTWNKLEIQSIFCHIFDSLFHKNLLKNWWIATQMAEQRVVNFMSFGLKSK